MCRVFQVEAPVKLLGLRQSPDIHLAAGTGDLVVDGPRGVS